MTKVFLSDYSKVYNIVYKKKKYSQEVNYILKILNNYKIFLNILKYLYLLSISNPLGVPTEWRHHGGETIRTTSQNKRLLYNCFIGIQITFVKLKFIGNASCELRQWLIGFYGGFRAI